jgi:2-hydroxychromene-2-carboxylate isomerase
MKNIVFYLDFISPYSYLAFEQLPRALEGISVSVEYRPVLFAGLLHAHGQRGPAEIAPKRDWTYRQVAWLAHSQGIALQLPTAHPFNPLPLLRLALACASGEGVNTHPNRYVCETLYRHVWAGGGDAVDPVRLAALTERLGPVRDPAGDAVKQQLRSNTEEALAQGVFGVPTCVAQGKHFWGFDALPMLRAALLADPWFDGPAWEAASRLPAGQQRKL